MPERPLYPIFQPEREIWQRPMLPGPPTITPAAVTVVLETASGVASATLVLTAPTKVVLSSSDGIASATLDLTAPTVAADPIQIMMGQMVSA